MERNEQDVQSLDAALKKICADTYGSVVVAEPAESATFGKLRAYGCVEISKNFQSNNGIRYEITDEGRALYRNGGFAKELMNARLIEASEAAAQATANLAKFQRWSMKATLMVASMTLLVLIVQVVIACLSYFCGKS
jgi:hypothetical protein